MSTISLSPIRYYDENDVYHYTVDNRPLEDLRNNIESIVTVVDNLDSGNVSVIGDWTGISYTKNVFSMRGKPFAYVLKLFAIQDSSVLTQQETTYKSQLIIGSVSDLGVVSIHSTNILSTNYFGATPLVTNFSTTTDNIVLTFSGYSGANGIAHIGFDNYVF
jgi:hypothetical protein